MGERMKSISALKMLGALWRGERENISLNIRLFLGRRGE